MEMDWCSFVRSFPSLLFVSCRFVGPLSLSLSLSLGGALELIVNKNENGRVEVRESESHERWGRQLRN